MPALRTRLNDPLNSKFPIIIPPMANVYPVDLISAATTSGAFGFVGAGALSPDALTDQLRAIKTKLGLGADDILPCGVGFITWILEKDISDASEDINPRLAVAIDQKVKAIWLAFGNDIGKYVIQVRSRSPGTVIFVLVNSVDEAEKAAKEWKADVLVVQGNEAGGHGAMVAPPLNHLLIAVTQALPPTDRPLIVAAGGISTGAQIASALTLGADGVALGTRFLMTHESGYSPERKEVLLKAGILSTARSQAFDTVNRTNAWPERFDGRAVANGILEDEKAGVGLEQRRVNAERDVAGGRLDRTAIWAGAGVGLVSELKNVKDVVLELNEEAVVGLHRATTFIVA